MLGFFRVRKVDVDSIWNKVCYLSSLWISVSLSLKGNFISFDFYRLDGGL